MTVPCDSWKCDLLLADDGSDSRHVAAKRLGQLGYRVREADSGEQAMRLAQRRTFDVAVIDMVLPGMSGIELLKQLTADSDCQVILLTDQGKVASIVEAMKLGAFDVVGKPANLADVEDIVRRAREAARLHRTNRETKLALQRSLHRGHMVGESPAMHEVYRLIQRAGRTDKPILIQGESGTGKELVANALYQASGRVDKPMIVVNCAALPDTLLESELFGHEKGTFTGAATVKLGLFEVADGGTLFIDEIGEMPGVLQAKLLRVLEDGSFRRVGATKERRVDVRLLTATNRDLLQEVKEGRFREDLYYRIDVMKLTLPPLRERHGDIQLLVHFLTNHDWIVEKAAMQALEQYPWPGNVRQLINAIERATIMADGRTILQSNLPGEVTTGPLTDSSSSTLNSTHESLDLDFHIRQIVEQALEREEGNKVRTARALGISRRSLYRLLEKYEIALV